MKTGKYAALVLLFLPYLQALREPSGLRIVPKSYAEYCAPCHGADSMGKARGYFDKRTGRLIPPVSLRNKGPYNSREFDEILKKHGDRFDLLKPTSVEEIRIYINDLPRIK